MGLLENLLLPKKQDILNVARAHGARNIRVFGSVARGTESIASDIDLLVEMEAERGLIERVALKQDLEDLLGRTVDLVTDRTLSRYLRETILAEARPL
ncbi:MAG: nucleotidyltransferase family protein [Rhodocyclales bacterium]|nr:nucleotidyltransferase family protein [Rhodocyclales bacterium]